MGTDKALLSFRGGPLLVSVARVVRDVVGTVTIVGDPARYGRLGFPVIADLFPGEGPLGGILTVLKHTTTDWNLITACDMPELSPAFLTRLSNATAQTGALAVLPRGLSGRVEPLCAAYHRAALEALLPAFENGVRKITIALEGLPAEFLTVTDIKPLQNLNTPEEWAKYAAG